MKLFHQVQSVQFMVKPRVAVPLLALTSTPRTPPPPKEQHKNLMSDQEQQDPSIFKKLSPKTQGILRANLHQQSQSKVNMATEQTYVDHSSQRQSSGGVTNKFCAASLLSSLMASRYANNTADMVE